MATSRPPRSSISPAAGLPQEDFEEDDFDGQDVVVSDLPGLANKSGDPDVPHEDKIDEMHVVEQEDGSAVITDSPEAEEREHEDFMENLAETLEESLLGRIGDELKQAVLRDKAAREQRDKDYAEGLKRTGLGGQAPGGAEFSGASRAVHPVLMEACIDFSARAMKELFPAKGPVKTHIIGKQTDEKLRRAERKKTYMNWQLTSQISEYRPELERLLTQLPLGGSQYLKFNQDDDLERPRAEFVPIDDIFLPYACSDFYSTPRLTHVQHLTREEFERRVALGMYRDVASSEASGIIPEQSAAAVVSDRIEGRDDEAYNEDGLRDVFEIQVNLDLEGEDPLGRKGRRAPYVVTVDDNSGRVLSIYRNWDEDDDKFKKLHWIVEWPMFPWRGAYAVGLGQAIGSLAGSATGALRALLDAAHIQNFPAALKLKGSRVSSQRVELQATGLTDIEGPTAVDDIRKLVMPLPFPGPSTVLFELMKFCVDAAKGLISTADEKIAEQSQNAPVGTTLALIEQGSITFSSVHARLHDAQRRCLEILHRLDKTYLEDEETVEELGELVVYRTDFQGPMDVQPVSDPNIFSDSQRYAQNQAAIQLKGMFPNALKDNVLVERTLRLLNVPDYEELLNVPAEPEHMDPVTENITARDPLKQIKVFDDNDDIEHLKTHIPFMTSPIFCANPLMANPALGVLIKHCSDHLAALYRKHAEAAVAAAQKIGLAMGAPDEDETDTTSGVLLAEQELAQRVGPLMDHLQKAMEMAKQFAPPPPPDPSTAVAQITAQTQQAIAQAREQGETQRTQMETAAKQAIEQLKQQAETQREQQRSQLEQMLTQFETAAAEREAEAQRRFEFAQAQQELATDSRNVAIAEESERRAQEANKAIAQLREDSATERAAMQAEFAERMAAIESHNQQLQTLLEHALNMQIVKIEAKADGKNASVDVNQGEKS